MIVRLHRMPEMSLPPSRVMRLPHPGFRHWGIDTHGRVVQGDGLADSSRRAGKVTAMVAPSCERSHGWGSSCADATQIVRANQP